MLSSAREVDGADSKQPEGSKKEHMIEKTNDFTSLAMLSGNMGVLLAVLVSMAIAVLRRLFEITLM